MRFEKIGSYEADFMACLNQACKKLGLDLAEIQKTKLLAYLDRLLLWNKAYNLTAITHPKEALIKHIFDCLSIIPHLPDSKTHASLLDVGTGAGLPAAIISICQPSRHCNALDSNQKKIRFIRQIASELQLDNLQATAERIEIHNEQYDVVTSRAFASLDDFVCAGMPRLTASGQLCAMKGKAPEDRELVSALALSGGRLTHSQLIKIDVPDLCDSRHLVCLS